jgi:hypothetical protein
MKSISMKLLALIFVSFLHFSSASASLEARHKHKSKPNPAAYDEVVSLGSRCQVAIQLEHNGIRHFAYPFDWIVTHAEGLGSFIVNQGAHFLDRDKVVYVGEYAGNPPYQFVMDTHYGFESYHDFLPPHIKGNFEEVKEKFQRRIKRFFALLNSNKKILFIRTDVTRAEAEYLDNIIHTMYPKLVYTFVALNMTDDFRTDWGHPRIKNFYLEINPAVWQGDSVRWKEILSNFTVTKPKSKRPEAEKW